MSAAQRINDFISTHTPSRVCNQCITAAVVLAKGTSYSAQVTSALATTAEFIQETATCSICKVRKLVIKHA